VSRRLATLLLVGATLAAFCNVFDNGFHLDDFYRVVDNPWIQTIRPIWRHFVDPRTMSTLDRTTEYRPLVPLTVSLNFWWSGSRVASYHAFNLVAHLASVLLVYAFLLELLRFGRDPAGATPETDGQVAFLASLLFAVHPVSGIVVNYVSARDLGMMEAFLAATMLAYVRMRRRGDTAWQWAVVLALFACSLLAKTNGIVMPALVFAFERLVAGRSSSWRASLARSAAFAAVVAIFFAWTRFGLHFSALQQVLNGGAVSMTYPLTQLWVHLIYLANAVWPFAIREMPAVVPVTSLSDWRPLAGASVVLSSAALAWRLRRTHPIVSFTIVAYWLLLLPESSVLPLYQLRNDYRPYPSSPFLFLACVATASRVWRPRLVLTAGIAAGVYLTAASLMLNRTWLTEETLWTHSVRYGGDEVAHVNLATAIADHRDPRVKANLEEALRLAPGFVIAHINYGLVLIELGDGPTGLAQVQEAVRLAPTWPQSHAWLAVAYEALGRLNDASDESLRAAQMDPHDLRQQYKAAMLLQRVGRYPESIPVLTGVSERAADYGLTDFLLALAFQQTSQCERAVPIYRRFLVRYPAHAQAHVNLAACYEQLGDATRAAEERRR
jgi:tetratricopeptide (TPR) repeat protein